MVIWWGPGTQGGHLVGAWNSGWSFGGGLELSVVIWWGPGTQGGHLVGAWNSGWSLWRPGTQGGHCGGLELRVVIWWGPGTQGGHLWGPGTQGGHFCIHLKQTILRHYNVNYLSGNEISDNSGEATLEVCAASKIKYAYMRCSTRYAIS